jgi:hypothetical protein
MKALTLTQPWATFVAHRLKTIETRSWRTPYVGWLAIHAAKRFPNEIKLLCKNDPFKFWLTFLGYTIDTLPLGMVIAKAVLIHCRKIVIHEDWNNLPPDDEIQFGDYSEDRFMWTFGTIERLSDPVPAKGRLGLWEWDYKGE